MIRGKKTRLRAIERSDIPRFVTWLNDPEVSRYLSRFPSPITMVEEHRWFEEQLLVDPKRRIFAIETEEGVHIGNAGLHNLDFVNGCAELGVMIGEKDHWDQGYGQDAVGALLGLAFGDLNLHRIQLTVFDFNPRAIRCYEKCGFRHEGILRENVLREGKYCSELLMSILRQEYQKERGGRA